MVPYVNNHLVSYLSYEYLARGNILTRSKPFLSLVDKAYAVCDNDMKGEVSRNEMYAGLLLVHLNLAKYAGAAACYVSDYWARNEETNS